MNTRYEKSRQYVGIDLHRRRSVIVRLDGEGEVLELGGAHAAVGAAGNLVGVEGPAHEAQIFANSVQHAPSLNSSERTKQVHPQPAAGAESLAAGARGVGINNFSR